jgi:CCR4-NOT transcription complex subunit 6
MASRQVTKSAIPITNPNAAKVPPPPEPPADSPVVSNANHPSSTVAPIAQAQPENAWTSLDMGGVNIKNLPSGSGLFSFSFLINLYLNHNSLSSIPPQIAGLKHLQLLDLSGNQLTSLPPELGLLTRLKELYLFDNQLTTLPYELGTLHQLQTLGIEGNPLDSSLKAIVQKDGTQNLIAHLRDTCPIPAPPPQRPWKRLISDTEYESQQSDASTETFIVFCYNILCERCATERLYGYTPSWALSWDYRKELILAEIMNSNADFLCLQEVDIAQYEDYFVKSLKDLDYEGIYYPKSRYKTMNDVDRRQVDGCAVFYKKSK